MLNTSNKPNKTSQMPEFVFGSLSTQIGRVKRARTEKFGFYHGSNFEPLDPHPGEPITILAYAGPGVAVKSATIFYTTDGSLPEINPKTSNTTTSHVQMTCSQIEWDTLNWGFIEQWSVLIPELPHGILVRYIITALTDSDQPIYCPHIDFNMSEIQENPDQYDLKYIEKINRDQRPRLYEVYVDDLHIPRWLKKAVIYQIFVDRFAPDPDKKFAHPNDLAEIYGGTLAGIRSKLDYLHDLGVNCIWLTPIFRSFSHHGYDSNDYESIEPHLGTMDDFHQLVQSAHDAGIRVVLDFVANHISNHHPAFIAAQLDPNSSTRKWFYFREYPDKYECYYDLPNMPIVNTDQREVRDYLIHAASFWLQQGCDGFRLDHAQGGSHAFWSEFRTATRTVKPDSVTFGEITDTPEVMRSFAGRMDGCLDFELADLLRSFFAYGKLTPSQFDRSLHKHFAYFGESMLLPSFLDNHDMNRFLWVVKGDKRKLQLAALCQFTLPSPPIIYYGTEVGLSQMHAVGRLEETRLPMPWNESQDLSLLHFYQQLIRLRRQTSQIWSLPRQTYLVNDQSGVYSYRYADLCVLLNNCEKTFNFPFKVEHKTELIFVTDASASLQNDLLILPPFAGVVCRIKLSQDCHPCGG